MADLKISDNQMQEVITEQKVIVHDIDKNIAEREEVYDKVAMYTAILADYDALIQRLLDAGCVPTPKPTEE